MTHKVYNVDTVHTQLIITPVQARLRACFSHYLRCVCVNFMHEFQEDSEREAFHGNFYLLSEYLLEDCREEVA